LLDLQGVEIPIFLSLPLNPRILMRIDLVSYKTLNTQTLWNVTK